jgi:large subunit ribosomal protein L4
MANVKLYNIEGNEVGSIELSDKVFGVTVNEHLLHMSVVAHLANRRQGTQSAKTRAEVRGGGRKPWRQKGTGHARQGSIRSPQWKGGGVVFAPKPRDYSMRINRKEIAGAIKSALSSRVELEKIYVLDDLHFDEIKTKKATALLGAFKLSKALVVIGEKDDVVVRSMRNIPGVKTSLSNTFNAYDVLKYDSLVITKSAVEQIEEVYA